MAYIPLSASRETLPARLEQLGVNNGILNIDLSDQNCFPNEPEKLICTTLDECKITSETAFSLGFAFGRYQGEADSQSYLMEYLRYCEPSWTVNNGISVKVRWGVGIRWAVSATITDKDADFNSLSGLAASAHFNFATVETKLKIEGLSHPNMRDAIPEETSFDVKSYTKMVMAFHNLRRLVDDSGAQVNPVVLGVSIDSELPGICAGYRKSLATTWALTAISKGYSMDTAMKNCNRETRDFQSIVRAVYIDILGIGNGIPLTEDLKPNIVARAKAAEYLKQPKHRKYRGFF